MEQILTPWERVKIARDKDRPYSFDYINEIFDRFLELHGDRFYGDDGAIVGGIGEINGSYFTIIAQQKGRNVKQNITRNFGMPSPEGYRKGIRLMKQAEKFNRPIICFVDTPGAYPGIEAEERGQGEAIAKSIFEMSGLKVPVLTIVIGEGGSGGALANAVANKVLMLENAMYSILSPEGFATILWKDGSRADEAASVMKCTSHKLLELGIIDGIIEEEQQASLENVDIIAEEIKKEILKFADEYKDKNPEYIRNQRYERKPTEECGRKCRDINEAADREKDRRNAF